MLMRSIIGGADRRPVILTGVPLEGPRRERVESAFEGYQVVEAGQIGRIPESRMLLMAGLMLADKTAGLEEKLHEAETKLGAQETLIGEMRANPVPEPEPERIEVAVIPPVVIDTMAELAIRAEALADKVEEKVKAE